MIFEWDREKARGNVVKHGVPFEVAMRVWDDPLHTTTLDGVIDGEERWRALGMVGAQTILLVAHIYLDDDGEHVRIISARRATRDERRDYEGG